MSGYARHLDDRDDKDYLTRWMGPAIRQFLIIQRTPRRFPYGRMVWWRNRWFFYSVKIIAAIDRAIRARRRGRRA